ncbi:hypothetical protein ACOI1C_12350 [Bacillus sp. DJP31]|uniref:hypothetical protein n=1 Tax=Bacillus sp. DJP31 TaxID=3409789 RepID=UPI003BB7E0D7
MRNTSAKGRTITSNNLYKVGKAVSDVRALIPSKNGEFVEPALIVYTRKAEYKDDPFKKRA